MCVCVYVYVYVLLVQRTCLRYALCGVLDLGTILACAGSANTDGYWDWDCTDIEIEGSRITDHRCANLTGERRGVWKEKIKEEKGRKQEGKRGN